MPAVLRASLPVCSPWPVAGAGWLRLAALRIGIVLVALGVWAGVQHQRGLHEAMLWQRLTPAAVERFVSDVAVPAKLVAWPVPTGPEALAALCQDAPPAWTHVRRGWQRVALAQCLAGLTQDSAALLRAETGFAAQLKAQHAAATQWLALHDGSEAIARTDLQGALRAAQGQSATISAGLPLPEPRQEWSLPVTRTQRIAVVAALADHSAALQAAQALRAPERARALGLLATGLRWASGSADGQSPKVAVLTVDRRSLAETLERVRRGAVAMEGVAWLADWRDLGAAIGNAGALLLLVVVLSGTGSWRRQLAVLSAWGGLLVLCALGALALTDLAWTGDPRFRLMAMRQWLQHPLGGTAIVSVPVPDALRTVVGLTTGALHLPVLALAGLPLLALLGRLPGLRALAARGLSATDQALAWLREPAGHGAAGVGTLGTMALAAWPLAAGALALVGVGGSAALAEVLLGLALMGLAAYAATHATLANVQEGVPVRPAALALGALATAAAGSAVRGDLGHLMVAALLAGVFVALFGWPWLRAALALVAVAGLAWLAASLAAAEPLPPLAAALDGLAPHARERIVAWFAPFEAGSSDLARVRWLVAQSGVDGWGLGRVPWGGLAHTGAYQGLPLQGPADYVLAVLAALWGMPAALGLLLLQVGVFVGAAALGLSRAFARGMRPTRRWLLAFGGLGCAVVALKALLSASGVTGLLPLTGIPVAVLGYGPVAQWAAFAYLAAALWPVQELPAVARASVRLRRGGTGSEQAEAGLLSRRHRALVLLTALAVGAWGVAAWRWAARDPDALPTEHRVMRLAGDPSERATQSIRTPNAWRALPGCLKARDGGALLGVCAGAANTVAALAPRPWATDPWLQRHLLPALQSGLREPSGRTHWNGREVPQGANLQLHLDPVLQPLAQQVADCYTGRLQGAACARVMPRDTAWAQRYFHGGLRAGALGLVLTDVETGEVRALANAMSDCTRANLIRRAQPSADGRWPALREGEPCAALPDHRSAQLPEHAPVHWVLPLGSSFKPWVVWAGLQAGWVNPAEPERWLKVLARSDDQVAIQRLAIEGAPAVLSMLAQAGYGEPVRDAAWGGSRPGSGAVHGWRVAAFEGLSQLRPARLGYERYREIEADKRAGLNADRRYGEATVREYLVARRLADASIGGGELRGSVFGLAQAWLDLVRTAQGQALGPRLHTVSTQPAAPVALGPKPSRLAQQQARWVVQASRGVTASSAQGTAQGSCRVVMGSCPATGWPGLVGKTGTADFLSDPEGGQHAKPGLQMPAKVFGGSFVAADGRRYVVTAMALRVRQMGTRTLELHSSAPAEAALTLVREMAQTQTPAR